MTSMNREIPELQQLASGRGLLRIPNEQDVPFTNRVRAVVDTPQFQRLNQIKQLGLANRVYPGAVHTRFEHALGVYHNALRFLAQLSQDRRFAAIVEPRQAELLIVSALLHDLGHWPLAHPIEDLDLPEIPSHEACAELFLCEDSELGEVLMGHWGVHPAEVVELLIGRSDDPAIQLLQSILSGPIDIDKMDYLERDSLHCGVPYGRNFDKGRLIRSLLVNEAGNGLAISTKGKTAAEMMVFARYVMFSEVYWHHTVRAATAMFCRGFYHLADRLTMLDFFKMTEAEAIRELRELAPSSGVGNLIEGVFGPGRQIYKRVAEYNFSDEPTLYEELSWRSYPFLVACSDALARRLADELQLPIRGSDILVDGPSRKREIQFQVDIYFPKQSRYRPLSSVSPVVETLARKQFDNYVKRARVFAHPRFAEAIRNCGCFDLCLTEAIAEVSDQESESVSDSDPSRTEA